MALAAGPELGRSCWTPLSHRTLRQQVFEERRALLGKWFDKWTDGQRRRVLVDLLERCSPSQQKFCAKQLQARVPTEAVDFTTRLPRVLSLYIFSFLDPRSLCRCAQVSWHWKYLSELDQLWMLKCLRFGWLLNFCPTPLEQGAWKKHYIQMVRELRLTPPKTPSKDEFLVLNVQPVKSTIPERNLSVGTSRGRQELRPWRCPDRNPTDTARYNHLDNPPPLQQARQGRRKGGANTPDLSRQEAERKRRGGRAPAQLRKTPFRSHSPRSVPAVPRPARAGVPPAEAAARSRLWSAAIRPGPVRAPEPRHGGAAGATGGDTGAPTPPLFEAQPWHIPSSNQGSDTE